MNAIERVRSAININEVIGGLLSADSEAVANEYVDAFIAIPSDPSSGVFARANEAAKNAVVLDAANNDRSRLKRDIAYLLGSHGYPGYGSAVDEIGLAGAVGYYIGRSIIKEIPYFQKDIESINNAFSAALVRTVDAGLTGDVMARAQKEVRDYFTGHIKKAQIQEKTNTMTQAAASVKPEDGPVALTGLIDLVKQQTEGMTPDEVSAYMRAGALAEIDRAALRVGRAILNDIGPERLPDGLKATAGKVRSEQVIIGKLKAATPEDALREYAQGVNAAMALLRDAVQAEYTADARKMGNELADAVDRGEIPESEFSQRYKDLMATIHQQAVERQQMMAREAVARQLGLTVEELDARRQEVEVMARTLSEERGRHGNEILNQLRGMGIDRQEAVRVAQSKVSMTTGARKLIGSAADGSVIELMRLIGRGVTDAGVVQVMSISEVKKQHPRLYRGRSVTRAFCAYGYRKTASGGEDIGVIGMGTQSRDVKTLWHEMGHWLEHNNPMVRGIVKAWFEKRTAGEKPVRLKNLMPHCNFGKDEIALKDNFINPYMGKVYDAGSTEIVSMGLEYLSDPATAAELASKDPDMFSLMVKIIEVVNAG